MQFTHTELKLPFIYSHADSLRKPLQSYNENCNNFIPLLFTDKCRYFFFGRLIQTEHYGKNNLLNESINCPERTMQKLIFRLNV